MLWEAKSPCDISTQKYFCARSCRGWPAECSGAIPCPTRQSEFFAPSPSGNAGRHAHTRCQTPQGDDNERTIPPHIFLIAEADAPSSLFSSFLDKEQAWKETQKERVELRADCENNTYIRLNVFWESWIFYYPGYNKSYWFGLNLPGWSKYNFRDAEQKRGAWKDFQW